MSYCECSKATHDESTMHNQFPHSQKAFSPTIYTINHSRQLDMVNCQHWVLTLRTGALIYNQLPQTTGHMAIKPKYIYTVIE